MTKIYITRHGETQFNAEVKAQGWADSPLTSVGIENAEALKRRLDNVDIDVIYTSPLGRAKTTAEILRGNRPIQIIQDDRLKEYRYGIIDGKPYEDGTKLLGMDIMYFFRNIYKVKPELYGGESFDCFFTRVSDALKDIVRDNPDKTVLIVSHAVSSKGLIHFASGNPIDQWMSIPKLFQASLTEINYENGKFDIISIGDTSHFTAEPSPQP